MNQETWKVIPEFENYAASDFGNVKRLTLSKKNCKPKQLKPSTNRDGYKKVTLYKDSGKAYFSVHRLIAKTFIGECPDNKQVNHKNGIRNDNRLLNLEYVTPSENKKHGFRIGISTRPIGEKNACAKLTGLDVQIIKQRILSGERQNVIAADFGVSAATICLINKNRLWSHIN